MKKRVCFILAALLCVFAVLSGGCAIGDLTGKDTYEGLPLYQYNVEDNTVEIDGALYHPIEYSEDIVKVIGKTIGFIWYKPHYEIEDGVVYALAIVNGDTEDKKYLYAVSYTYYQTENGKVRFDMLLERED